jgi:hypothetical protein
MNEELVLRRFQACFSALLGSGRKSPLVIVFTGSAATADQVERLLRDAWLLMDKEEVDSEQGLFSLFDVQIILTPRFLKEGEAVNPEATAAVDGAIAAVPTDLLAPLSRYILIKPTLSI